MRHRCDHDHHHHCPDLASSTVPTSCHEYEIFESATKVPKIAGRKVVTFSKVMSVSSASPRDQLSASVVMQPNGRKMHFLVGQNGQIPVERVWTSQGSSNIKSQSSNNL
jgi:hypothetical protein